MNRAVIKAFDILEYLQVHKDGRTLSQLAEDLKLPISSVSDIVKTLVKQDYVQRDTGSRNMFLASSYWTLDKAICTRWIFTKSQFLFLGQVSKRFEAVASVYLFDRRMRKILLIAEEGGAPHLRFGWQLRGPVLHCTGPGKVVLASLTDAAVEEILTRVGMPQLTPHTMTSISSFKKELSEVRKRGYALDRQETFLDIGCIAIPIVIRGAPIGSLTIRMLIERMQPAPS